MYSQNLQLTIQPCMVIYFVLKSICRVVNHYTRITVRVIVVSFVVSWCWIPALLSLFWFVCLFVCLFFRVLDIASCEPSGFKDDFHVGCRNFRHQHRQSLLHSPGWVPSWCVIPSFKQLKFIITFLLWISQLVIEKDKETYFSFLASLEQSRTIFHKFFQGILPR